MRASLKVVLVALLAATAAAMDSGMKPMDDESAFSDMPTHDSPVDHKEESLAPETLSSPPHSLEPQDAESDVEQPVAETEQAQKPQKTVGLGFNILTGRTVFLEVAKAGSPAPDAGATMPTEATSEPTGEVDDAGLSTESSDHMSASGTSFRQKRAATLVSQQHHQHHSHRRHLLRAPFQSVMAQAYTTWTQELRSEMVSFRGKGNAFGGDGPFTMKEDFRDILNQYAAGQIVYETRTTYKTGEESLRLAAPADALREEVCGPNYPTCTESDFSKCQKEDLRYFSAFVSKFGSHYISSASLGGEKVKRYNFNSRSPEFQDSLAREGNSLSTFLQSAVTELESASGAAKALSAGLSFPGSMHAESGAKAAPAAQASVAGEFSEAMSRLKKLKKRVGVVSIRTATKGGNPAGANGFLGGDIAGWISSIKSDPAPVDLEILPMTGLIARLDCDGAKKAALFHKAVKEVLSLRYAIAQSTFAMAEARDAEEQQRQLVIKVKTDWLDRMRHYVVEKMKEELPSEETEKPDIKPETDEDGKPLDNSSPENTIPPGFTLDPVDLRRWIGQEANAQTIVTTPVFALQQMNLMSRQCASFCSAQRTLTRQSLVFGSSPPGSGGGTTPPSADGGPESADVTAPKEAAAEPQPAKKPSMLSMTPLNFQTVENQEQQCQQRCGSTYGFVLSDYTELHPGIDSHLNSLFMSLTKRSCVMCNRAVALDALQAAPGLEGDLITRPTSSESSISAYCSDDFLSNDLEKQMCRSVTTSLAVEMQKSTRFDGDEFFNRESLAAMLVGLSSCVTNCHPEAYSFSNLAKGAAPGTWATQVCGYYMNCPTMESDDLAVTERLRSMADHGEGGSMAASELREATEMGLTPQNEKPPKSAVGLPTEQAQRKEFCQDILTQEMGALALRQRKLSEAEDQTCYICLSEVENALAGSANKGGATDKDADDVCKSFTGKDEKAPDEFKSPMNVNARLQALRTGYSAQAQLFYSEEMKLPKKPKTLRRRRLLRVAQEARAHGDDKKNGGLHQLYQWLTKKAPQQMKMGTERGGAQPNPADMKECAAMEMPQKKMKCKYELIWKNKNIECGSAMMEPKKTFEDITKFKTKMSSPFEGSANWCKQYKEAVESGTKVLADILKSIVVDDYSGAGEENAYQTYMHLHTRVFMTMTAKRGGRLVQHAALRSAFRRATVGRELANYAAPLAAGPSALCIELNMCSPIRANAILDSVRAGTPPYPTQQKAGATTA